MGGSKMDIRTTVASGKQSPVKIGLAVAITLAIIFLPVMFQALGQFFMIRTLAQIGLYVMLALGLNIVVGFAGLLDLGYIAFYAMGAYTGVLVGQAALAALGDGWAPWIYYMMLPVAAIAAAMTGVALGTPVLRLRGDYLAIVTLGFGEIVRLFLVNNVFGLTNGASGLIVPVQLQQPAGLAFLQNNITFPLPNGQQFQFTGQMFWYYIIVLLCIVTVSLVRRLDDSRLGRSWVAMREDEVAATSVGVNITGAKLWAFSLGALAGGVAGVTFAFFQGFVSPESFTFMESVFVVCVVVLGGMGSIPGAIIGAILIQGLPLIVQGYATSGLLPLSSTQASLIGNYRYLVFGFLMVVMMAVRPQGMIPSQRRARELKPESDSILDEENQTLYDAEHVTDQPDDLL